VRIFDIKLPGPEKGGIFGSDVTAGNGVRPSSRSLFASIEETILNCHGVLFDTWIDYLLKNNKAQRIVDLCEKFVDTTRRGSNGFEKRFANKFGVLYAAGTIAVEAGLLPWPSDWPMRAVRHCYEIALEQLDPEIARMDEALKDLAASLRSKELFPIYTPGSGQYPQWNDHQIGIRRVLPDGSWDLLFARDRLQLVNEFGIESDRVEMELAPPGSGEQIRMKGIFGIVKPRLLRLKAKKLVEWAETMSDVGA
jgi:hypothetical protein